MRLRGLVVASLVSLASVVSLTACEDEAPPPVAPPQPQAAPPPVTPAEPTDPAPVVDGDVTVAWANGVKILIKRIPGAELASMQLYIKGGARDWTAEDAGIERLALAVAASGGTESLDKDAFARRLAALGSELGSGARFDYADLQAKSLTGAWDDTFGMLVDTFLHPAMPATELEVERQGQIGALRREQDNPDSLLGLAVHRAVFKGHPFENRTIGTIETVQKLGLDALRAHLGKLRETSRLLFVTAGDVDPAHVVEKVKAAFGGLPRGTYQGAPFPAVRFEKAALSITEKALPTNYIQGAFPTPALGDADYADGAVAMSMLGYRLFEEVRTKRNLSYAPSARMGGGSTVPLGSLYVTAVDPNTTLKVMFDEVRKLQNEPISEKDLAATKATYLTHYLMANETTDGQADMLAEGELLGGSYKVARALPERIRAVTAAGVQAFAKKYLGHLQMVVVGDPSKIDKSLFVSL
jgi:zinc protease